MKLSNLYSNKEDIFPPISFNEKLNVIIGEIKLPENKKRDTHNLGKTTLIRLINFMLLAKRDRRQFLFKNYDTFEGFVFFLEIKLNSGMYLTIRRGVKNNTKISFKSHSACHQDFRHLSDDQWDHLNVSFDKSKDLLESYLSHNILTNWDYRKLIGFHIRTQEDFDDVFRLSKYRSVDSQWKPYVADLLGFDGAIVLSNYQKQKELEDLDYQAKLIPLNSKNLSAEISSINGKLLLRKNELAKLESFINEFNFSEADQAAVENIVGKLNSDISQANALEYSIKNNISRIKNSLSVDKIEFNTQKVLKLFNEVNILFPEQITKDFNDLIAFNNSITVERASYLYEELERLKVELIEITKNLNELNVTRTKQLSFLVENELIVKFKESSAAISKIKADIEYLTLQKESIEKIASREKESNDLKGEISNIQLRMQENINSVTTNPLSIYSETLIYFNEIISRVLNKEGGLTIFRNSAGNIDFDASYKDPSGIDTSEGDGNSYKKFLCIAFDMAISRAYLDSGYIKFIYIDGVFEGLDVRKKQIMLDILREYTDIGLQIIVTTIDSDLIGMVDRGDIFLPQEITLKLSDEGSKGLLFKMDSW